MSVSDKKVLLDCRFIGLGGAGKVAELLLRGLQELQPEGQWILWGPRKVSRFAWAGARTEETRASPLRLWGQRDLLRIPKNDIAIYMHQIRPLRAGPSLTVIHDTIPLRFGNRAARPLKKVFLSLVAEHTSRVLTDSNYSAECLRRDLGIDPGRIRVIHLPVDDQMIARVRSLRSRLPTEQVILFVGRFAPHKNLDRLISAFGDTRFRQRGGILHLVGGTPDEVRRLELVARRKGISEIRVEPTCSQERLEDLYARACLLVMPSLEEGFGLPAQEAVSAGLRISVSDGGALPEIFGGIVEPFPARSVPQITAALDRDVMGQVPTGLDVTQPIDFAKSVVAELEALTHQMKHARES